MSDKKRSFNNSVTAIGDSIHMSNNSATVTSTITNTDGINHNNINNNNSNAATSATGTGVAIGSVPNTTPAIGTHPGIPSNPSTTVTEDSADDVNFVIRHLSTPSDNLPTYVSKQYNNDSIMGNEIQAYAKIAGCNWTYYVKSLTISIGRNTDFHATGNTNNNSATASKDLIDIDLGPSKVVSRKHATIEYNLNGRKWQLFINGRNGLKVNGMRLNLSTNTPYDLSSGNIIDIGGTQMMFVLPDAPPVIPDYFRHLLSNKRLKMNTMPSSKGNSVDFNSKSDMVNTQVKAFQLQEGLSSLNPHSASSEQDYSKDDAKDLKPPYSYATMITQAILSNPQGILSLAEIYDWISSHFAYYRHTKQGWQNSIRHNLSLNKAFEKVPRKPNEPGKGMKWQISESYRNEFLKKWQDGSLNKVRRGTSVSRQLQLHLIKNNALPKGRTSPTFVDESKRHLAQLPTPINMSQLPPPNSIPFNPNHSQEKLNNPSFLLPNLSPNKNNHNDLNFMTVKHEANSNLPSPIKTMSIPDINYLNNDPKLSSGLVSGLNNTNTSDQLLNSTSNTDNSINNPKLENKNNSIHTNSTNKNNNSPIPINNNANKYNEEAMGRPHYIMPATKLQPINPNSAADENQLNSLSSPKKIFHRLDLMTPERNLQRPNLEMNSAQSQQSVNSSPALWNYVQFSTPLGPANGTGTAGNGMSVNMGSGGDHDKLPKLELESPLKNRRTTSKVSDLKDVDLVKGFKQ